MLDVLVLGGSGVLGRKIAAEAASRDRWRVVVGDRVADRGRATAASLPGPARSAVVDVRSAEDLERAVTAAALVLVAVEQDGALVQQVCRTAGVPCVDVSTSPRTLADVEDLGPGSPSLVMAGLFPGLSGLLLDELTKGLDEVRAADVVLVQSANAHVGGSGTARMLQMLAGSAPTSGPAPGVAGVDVRVLPLQHPEGPAVGHPEARYWTGWDDGRLTATVAMLRRTRLLGLVATPRVASLVRHDPRRPEAVTLAVRVQGTLDGATVRRERVLRAMSDYGATARLAVVLGELALERTVADPGHPARFASAGEVLARCGDDVVRAWLS
ncbi:saccharopine dehydrogenase NADP-binding domain-containing protein [Cellulosimicrobium cellulans]|uniref:saccharopine dehydrogenase NADP-binding domain-containing protein n=1 Tax=Cellulosimicrobium cellulans TaxID=1710 RepID=UPI0008485026|nr:saccharopine dehydrogenase NADP-binding domain-containing protein [Cellulosimicrobium cellulans]